MHYHIFLHSVWQDHRNQNKQQIKLLQQNRLTWTWETAEVDKDSLNTDNPYYQETLHWTGIFKAKLKQTVTEEIIFISQF